ncbi:single-stranded-DNA-specific exonuclease RecJ [Rickettsiales bacterium]|nr:single-stranded-DNA-specific exonuclease RecJ [Rickettsiales bacterium]
MTLQTDYSVKGAKWILNSFSEHNVALLVQRFGLPEAVARIIDSRGINISEVEFFLSPAIKHMLPDPFHLLDMEKAVDCLVGAIKNNQTIAIFGDYDVDGATSTALLRRYFDVIGVASIIYVPDRIEEGYGPTQGAFAKLHSEGADLCITVDCGVNAHEALASASEMGLPVIVIDHHIGSEILPKAAAAINPNRLDESSKYTNLAAVGVTFLFVVALNKRLREIGFFIDKTEPNLIDYLDLVALGTVCDVVSLTGLNRAFVSVGLKVMARNKNPGIKALADLAGLRTKLDTYHLGFILGPRINAGGRVGESFLGAKLLSTNDPDEARRIAEKLNEYNSQRQALEQKVFEDALLQVPPDANNILVVKGQGWHPGVIGIVAGRLKERFGLPAVVISITEGIGRASGRSVAGVDLGSAILAAKAEGMLISGGGHAMAAGFSLLEEQISSLHEFLSERFGRILKIRDVVLGLDGVLGLSSVNLKTWYALQAVAPFGAGNPEPKFIIRNAHLLEVRIVAKEHILCDIACGLSDTRETNCKAIAFRAVGTALGEVLLASLNRALTLAARLILNRWRGEEKVELIIEDAMF